MKNNPITVALVYSPDIEADSPEFILIEKQEIHRNGANLEDVVEAIKKIASKEVDFLEKYKPQKLWVVLFAHGGHPVWFRSYLSWRADPHISEYWFIIDVIGHASKNATRFKNVNLGVYAQ